MIPKTAVDFGPVADVIPSRLVLAGPGRAGRAFARSWVAAGGRIEFVIVRGSPPGAPRIPGVRETPVDEVGKTPETREADIFVAAVSDDAIESLARTLAPRFSCRVALHLSGALPGQALAPLDERGAALGSLHPVRPFTGAPEEDWREAFVAVEGEPAAVETATAIARAVGARPHTLAPSAKPLYHAAASLAAGGAAAVVSVAVDGWIAAGVPEATAREVLSGLAERAVAAVGKQPFREAFTGAVARRDVGTVRAHTAALAAHPEAFDLYRALAEEILRRTHGRGKEQEIRDVLARVGNATSDGVP
jgi:predicted short-subunit dehydrogenase-like oxidoreductase (DUF2520 family)